MADIDADAAVARIHEAVQRAMSAGELEPGMLQSWYLIGTGIDTNGDETIIILNDSESRTARALGLVRYAEVLLEDQVRRWGQDSEIG